MIRVNLLPVKRRKKPIPIPPFLGALVLILFCTGIGLVYTSSYLNKKIAGYTAQRKNNEKKIAELDKKIKEVQNYEANNKAFEEKKNIIEQLQHSQNAPVRLMIETVLRLTDGVWLDSLDENNWMIKIAGKSFSNAEIVNFVDSLKGSEYFSGVVLIETKKVRIKNVPAYSFKLTMHMKV